ncbi:MAG TPA: GNAT family N-acetyltransferase [Ignavibacteria bacterium]|nr:GNAT family N-acetyltransferase [Ignavibacteria bacterium]HMR39256.1 GNAT family N-acetyltransferase [Ignavibacteria bacterium]
MLNIKLTKASICDLEKIRKIGIYTIIETFALSNEDENTEKYLSESFDPEKVLKELTNPDSEFFLAESDNKVIGYLKINFNKAQSDLNDPDSLEIERIYVYKEYHGKGIGKILFDKALETALRNKLNYIWLGVWENNHRAIAFYKKSGFIEFDKHIFRYGNDDQTDLLMKLVIS